MLFMAAFILRLRAHSCIYRGRLATLRFLRRPSLTKIRIPDIVDV
jgi:hypothetical protein